MSSGDGDHLVVPKFGSFKSKETQEKTEDRNEDRKRDSRGDRRKRSHHDERHERRRRDSSRESKRRRERHRSRERESRTDSKHVEKKPVSRPLGPELFIVDTKGDPLIRRYGTLDRSQVPAYYRHGYGRVLGTSGRLIIYRDGPNDSFGLRMPGEGLPRYRDRDGLRSKRPMAHSQPIPLRRRQAAPIGEEEEEDGFLSIKSSKKRKQNGDSSEEEGPSYRSIEGKAKAKNHDSDMDSDSDTSDEIDNVETSNPLKWKSIQLNRRVKENPDDIDSWLELVEHQDELLLASIAEGTPPDNEAHSYSEIKVSMLEKALQNARDAADRERILVSLMREGAKVWSSKAAAKKWTELGNQAHSHALWRVRLDFALTSITEFDHTMVKTMLLDRLRLVSSAGGENTQTCLEAIEVFLLATRFVHDTGYRELSVAAWQALLELTFFRPENHAQNATSVPDSFKEFWESEVPRIGDVGALGWKHYVATDGEDEPPEPVQAPPIKVGQSRDAFKAWCQLEIEQAHAAKLPARTMDDGTEDDPFRVVTYTDIEPFLFMIPLSIVSSLRSSLLDAFVIFCGLPPASSSDWARTLYRDQFLAPIASNIPSVDMNEAKPELDEDEAVVRRPPLFTRPYSAFAISSRLLFPNKEWFSYLHLQIQNTSIDGNWLETTMSQLVFSAGCKEVAEYYLAVSFARDSSSVKKTAKKLLKQSPDNAALYNAYALAEHARGNTDVATKVLESAISSPLLSQQRSRFQLYHTSAWMALENGDTVASKRALCSAGRVDAEVSFADVLKASSYFAGSISESLSMGDLDSAAIAAECLVLHSYLTNSEASEPMSLSQGNISAAMQTLDSTSQELASRGRGITPSCERLAQFGIHLLYLHATRGPHRRAYIRDQARKHLQSFPSNAILLSVLEWSDAGLRIVDETRQLLRDQTLLRGDGDSVGRRLFAVQHELGRGNVHTAQAAFEQAVRSDACKASVVLWVWYIRFAHAYRKQLRGGRGGGKQAAVDVFYRALRHCPWAKVVFMEAFSTLAGDMASDELRSAYSMMTSKGLRVHVELDEFMESRRGD